MSPTNLLHANKCKYLEIILIFSKPHFHTDTPIKSSEQQGKNNIKFIRLDKCTFLYINKSNQKKFCLLSILDNIVNLN